MIDRNLGFMARCHKQLVRGLIAVRRPSEAILFTTRFLITQLHDVSL